MVVLHLMSRYIHPNVLVVFVKTNIRNNFITQKIAPIMFGNRKQIWSPQDSIIEIKQDVTTTFTTTCNL